MLRFCGDCHRHPDGPRPDQIRRGDPLLARFQPIGLSMSKCFKGSAGGFSCVTCHDPHGRASSERASYDAVCLKCHTTAVESSALTPKKPDPDRPGTCKVSPGERCVECHMPRVDIGHKVLLSDHWIRVHKDDPGEAAGGGEDATTTSDLHGP
jgi:predicted CXXCH cytochrome family protein